MLERNLMPSYVSEDGDEDFTHGRGRNVDV